MAEVVSTLTPEERSVLEKIVGEAPGGTRLLPPLPPDAVFPRVAEILTQAPKIGFVFRNLQPPTSLYISPNESLGVDSYGSVVGLSLIITARFLLPDGQLTMLRYTHTPNTNRTVATQIFPLTEGFLLGLQVDPDGAAALRGQCFVQLTLNRGLDISGLGAVVLARGYAYDGHWVSWPQGTLESSVDGQGFIRAFIGTDPAANTGISETVPTNALWEILALQCVLTTDGNVATRQPQLVADDGANPFLAIHSPATQGANNTQAFYWNRWAPLTTTVVATRGNQGVPDKLFLREGFRLRVTVDNMQVGDDLSAPVILLREWIETSP